MEKTNLKMTLGATGPGTNLTISLDQQIIWAGDPGVATVDISHDFDDSERDHVMIIALSGKTEQHTIVNEQDEIVEDLLVSLRDITLAGVDISQIIYEKSQYRHDFNGSQEEILDQFFGDMGCNGQIEFRFSSPSYLWILENT